MEAYLAEEEIPEQKSPDRLTEPACLETKVTRSSAGSSFRTRACSRCSTRSSNCCPRRSRCPPVTGVIAAGKGQTEDRRGERPADDDGPFAALAFKVMTDPYVGKLTYFRVYFWQAGERRPRPQRQNRPHRADRQAC